MKTCNINPSPVLKSNCRSLAPTRKILLSKSNFTYKSPLESGDIDGDITALATIQDKLEAGTVQVLSAHVDSNNSADSTTVEVAGIEFTTEQGEVRMSMMVETSMAYLEAVKELKAYTDGYIAFVNADNVIRLKSSTTSGDLKFFKLRQVTPIRQVPANVSGELDKILVKITLEPSQMFEMVEEDLQYSYLLLEQLNIASDVTGEYDDTTGVTLTDASGDVLIDGSGTDESVGITFTVDDVVQTGVTFTVSSGVMTTTGMDGNLGADISVVIDNESDIWNDNYYGKSFLF